MQIMFPVTVVRSQYPYLAKLDSLSTGVQQYPMLKPTLRYIATGCRQDRKLAINRHIEMEQCCCGLVA